VGVAASTDDLIAPKFMPTVDGPLINRPAATKGIFETRVSMSACASASL
jgi:hypothetical protein